jgi:hypothetical protein
MASPLDISAQDAHDIIISVSRRNGWLDPEFLASTPAEALEALSSLRRQLGDTVEMYVILKTSSSDD